MANQLGLDKIEIVKINGAFEGKQTSEEKRIENISPAM